MYNKTEIARNISAKHNNAYAKVNALFKGKRTDFYCNYVTKPLIRDVIKEMDRQHKEQVASLREQLATAI